MLCVPNTVSVNNNPLEVNENSSVNRVYGLSTALRDFSGTLFFCVCRGRTYWYY